MKKLLSFWRWIIGAAIGFGTIFFVAYQQHAAAEKYKHHREEYCSALFTTAKEQKSCIEERTDASDYLPWGYELLGWPEGITTWAIILTGFAIAWQSWETRKAAKATEASAEAARLNAQAIVDSERPWLIAETVRDSINYHFYHLQFTNFGRTPARFIRGDATHVFAENPQTLRIPPIYSSPIVLPKNLVIAPSKGFTIPHGYNIPNLLQLAGGQDKTLVIYGRVIYEDTIIPGIEHEVAWCFGYIYVSHNGLTTEGDFVLTGPSEYTKNT